MSFMVSRRFLSRPLCAVVAILYEGSPVVGSAAISQRTTRHPFVTSSVYDVIRLRCHLFTTSSVCDVVHLQRRPFVTSSVCDIVHFCGTSYVVRMLTCDTGNQCCPGLSDFAVVAVGNGGNPPLANKPIGLRAQCDKEGSGSESVGDFVVVCWLVGSLAHLAALRLVGGVFACLSARSLTRRLSGLSAAIWLVCQLGHPLGGSLARQRRFGSSAALWLIVGSVARSVAPWLVGSALARCWLLRSLGGSLACRRHFGLSSASSLAWWLSGSSAALWLVVGSVARSVAPWLIGGALAHRRLLRSLSSSLAHWRRFGSLLASSLARWLSGLSAALRLVIGSFACSAAPWLVGGASARCRLGCSLGGSLVAKEVVARCKSASIPQSPFLLLLLHCATYVVHVVLPFFGFADA